MAKQKIRIAVEMYGGTIQNVVTDSDVELDVVFLEDGKYVLDSGDKEFEVQKGPFDGQFIFTHHAQCKVDKADLDPVFEAAQERIDETKQ